MNQTEIDRLELSDRDLEMIAAIRSGRIHDVERDVRDVATLQRLQRKQLAYVKDGRPRLPRSSSNLSRMLQQGGGRLQMITREEVHLSAMGLRVYGEFYHRDGRKKEKSNGSVDKTADQLSLQNIPGYVAASALAQKKFTAEELQTIDANLYQYFTPDWSEDTWRKTWSYFRDTLSLVEAATTKPTSLCKHCRRYDCSSMEVPIGSPGSVCPASVRKCPVCKKADCRTVTETIRELKKHCPQAETMEPRYRG